MFRIKRMRVGIDGYPLSQPLTGVGHYTFELARALARHYPADEFELVSPQPFNSSVIEKIEHERLPNLRLTKAKSSSLRGHWWSIGLPLYAQRARFDVFHGTNFELPLWTRGRTVLTIHDLSTVLFPRTHRQALARRARVRLPISTKLAQAIITPTESVKREVREHLKVNLRKITAIHEAPRASFQPIPLGQTEPVRKRLRIEDDFLLFVGTLEPRKNLSTLLQAYAQVLHRTPLRLQLVLAGAEGWLIRDMLALIKSEAMSGRVLLTGYLPDADLGALYSSCRVFIYPSLYEGFGLPPLEAMACGAPVIASRVPALQETLDGAALFADATDVDSLTEKIVEVLTSEDKANAMRADSIEHAGKFSWDKTARLTRETYERVLAK